MIEIMPETETNTLIVKATGKLTVQDYEEILIPKLEQLLQKYSQVKAVIYITKGFQGWELGAVWDDAKFGIKHRKDFDKIAVVGGAKWLEWITKIGACLITGEIKVYKESELISAI
jgi:hypothetical protein